MKGYAYNDRTIREERDAYLIAGYIQGWDDAKASGGLFDFPMSVRKISDFTYPSTIGNLFNARWDAADDMHAAGITL